MEKKTFEKYLMMMEQEIKFSPNQINNHNQSRRNSSKQEWNNKIIY